MNLGVAYEDRREYDKAIECYRQVLRVEPNHSRARMYLKDAHASLDMAYDEDHQRELSRRAKLLGVPVSDFEFSVRVRNCLQRMNIHSLGDLARLTEEELLASKNFGETSLQEIKEVLGARGLRLGDAREEVAAQAAPALEPAAEPEEAAPDEAVLKTPITELDLSMRSRKCMERLGIVSIGQLIEHNTEELLASRNFGRTSLAEVNEKLARFGLRLQEPPPPEDEEAEEEPAEEQHETADDAQ
jgi:DNA-directed RNA polymerase subunit alpha